MIYLRILVLIVFALLATSLWAYFTSGSYATADRSSVGIAPNPAVDKDAIVQLYAARAFSWKGIFGKHMWIATKEKDAEEFTIYQVVGWRLYRGLSCVAIDKGVPDRKWFNSVPKILITLRGEEAEKAIPKIQAAAESYPFANQYRIWPGPNSNTFISHIFRNTPEFGMELPPDALGKDYLGSTKFVARTESGTGYQISFFGVLGVMVGLNEGIEVNLLGMSFGFDFLRPALKLPFIGRIGMHDRPIRF